MGRCGFSSTETPKRAQILLGETRLVFPLSCNLLGSTLFHPGEYERAQDLHREALAFYQSRQQAEGIVWSLERLTVVEAAHGDAQKAARLLGAASVMRDRHQVWAVKLGLPVRR